MVNMNNIKQFQTIPLGSVVPLPSRQRLDYISRALALSENIQDILFEPRTGAYLRGLVKTYNLSEEKTRDVAMLVLQVAVGEIELGQLSDYLAKKIHVDGKVASNMSLEIEKDLFAPVMMELGKVQKQAERPAGKSENTTSPSPSLSRRGDQRPEHSGMSNVLDLKEKRDRPQPPPIPR